MDIDQHLKKQLLETPKYLKKYLKEHEEHSPGITYYTGNWGQDLEDNLTDTQRKKLRKQIFDVETLNVGNRLKCALAKFGGRTSYV